MLLVLFFLIKLFKNMFVPPLGSYHSLTSPDSKAALETLLYEKWSSFFHISFSATRRLESEGGALWREHSCSGHRRQSCNLHWNGETLDMGNYVFFTGPKKTI